MKFDSKLDYFENMKARRNHHSSYAPYDDYIVLKTDERNQLMALNEQLKRLEEKFYPMMVAKKDELLARINDPTDWMRDFNFEIVFTFYLREDDPECEEEDGRHVDPPRCNHCGGRVRPGVVWFGEMLPDIEWDAANDAAHNCDAFFCIGTSSLVQPAARLSHVAIKRGALVIQINPNPTSLDAWASLNLHGAAGEVMPWLLDQVWGSPK